MWFRGFPNIYVHLGVHDGLAQCEAVFDKACGRVVLIGFQLLSENYYDDRRRGL